MKEFYNTYGSRKAHGVKVALHSMENGGQAVVPEPEPPAGDKYTLCGNCNYGQHGVTCSDPGDTGCLKADMDRIYKRQENTGPSFQMGL